MSFDWTHQFCLACDKQTEGTYCSESCRLADYERTSAPSSVSNSPSFNVRPNDWNFPKSSSGSTKFYLFAYDSRNFGPYGAAENNFAPSRQSLSHSSSYSSLHSVKAATSTGSEAAYLSDSTTRELRAYARSFDSVRLQRRRSH